MIIFDFKYERDHSICLALEECAYECVWTGDEIHSDGYLSNRIFPKVYKTVFAEKSVYASGYQSQENVWVFVRHSTTGINEAQSFAIELAKMAFNY